MTDAAADLPGHQRILIRKIVADNQHRFGLIQLLHGEKGIGGAIAEGGDKSRVVGGAVMVNVISAESCARQALEQVVFFVRSAVRADEAYQFLAAGVVSGL